ncbi:MAG: preprotein translocase subunit YajC [Lacipirellulaceae bacterium]
MAVLQYLTGDFLSSGLVAQGFWLLAETEGKKPAADPGGFAGLPFTTLLPIILLLFYFMVLRPQQKAQNETRDQIANLKTKDRVITIGGIHGTVTNIQKEQQIVTIQIDEATGAKMRIGTSAIKEIVTDETKADKK